MKIAIMTQPLGKNYGGILQAYALQKILKDQGHEVVTIDRQPDKRILIIKLLYFFKSIIYKILRKNQGISFTPNQSAYVYSEMTDFIHKYIQLSKPLFNGADLKSHYKQEKYNLVIVGSDQVWRPKYSPSLYNYFVDFIGKEDISISYAASFGVDEWEFDKKQTIYCKNLIRKFNAVSVREKSAVTLCKKHLNVNAQLVLDPTMLITVDEYKQLLSSRKSKGTGGILRYILDDSKYNEELLDQVANQLDKEIFASQPNRMLINSICTDMDEYKYPAVEDWIMSFRDADFVVTDSFHGCVFSIIFNKPFIAIGNKERGLGRFESLLTIFGLSDRLITDSRTSIQTIVKNQIEWGKVNLILNKHKEESMSFLDKWTEIN